MLWTNQIASIQARCGGAASNAKSRNKVTDEIVEAAYAKPFSKASSRKKARPQALRLLLRGKRFTRYTACIRSGPKSMRLYFVVPNRKWTNRERVVLVDSLNFITTGVVVPKSASRGVWCRFWCRLVPKFGANWCASMHSAESSTMHIMNSLCLICDPLRRHAKTTKTDLKSADPGHVLYLAPRSRRFDKSGRSPPQCLARGVREVSTLGMKSFLLPHYVLSTTRFPEAVGGQISYRLLAEYFKTSPNSSPNCAPKRLQIVLSAPLYSVDNTRSPALTTALLTEGL
jgi:hypothetical protein